MKISAVGVLNKQSVSQVPCCNEASASRRVDALGRLRLGRATCLNGVNRRGSTGVPLSTDEGARQGSRYRRTKGLGRGPLIDGRRGSTLLQLPSRPPGVDAARSVR
ncbi:hypothetical protein LSAT2_030280 [Lamellibrachia satsuma]|nr:hypothetical protein LSAT2_030280 [Lamellibrachia satsuma]